MSKALLQNVWAHFPRGGSHLTTLVAIAEGCVSDSGSCQWSLRELSAAARVDRATCWRALRQLKKERWIVTDRIGGPGGFLLIQINLPKLGRSVRPGPKEMLIDTRPRQGKKHVQEAHKRNLLASTLEAPLKVLTNRENLRAQIAVAGESTLKFGQCEANARREFSDMVLALVAQAPSNMVVEHLSNTCSTQPNTCSTHAEHNAKEADLG